MTALLNLPSTRAILATLGLFALQQYLGLYSWGDNVVSGVTTLILYHAFGGFHD
jgi:hypothetical protein